MRRIADINFAVTRDAHPLFAWVLLLAGGTASMAVTGQYGAIVEERESQIRQIGRLERRLAPPVMRHGSVAQQPAQANLRESAPFPWSVVLGEIERAVDPRIALLSFETDITAARTRLVAEARTINDALGFAARLRAAAAVRRVLLLAHETRQEQVGAVIGFTLQIEWSID